MSNLQHVCTFPGCDAKFQRPSKLIVHLRKHTGERPFVCDDENCSKTYTNESHLRRHKHRSHQKDTNKTCKCSVEGCSKEFSNVDNLKRHKNTVHRKDYICYICNEGFNKKHKLRSHILEEHVGELNIKCDYCPLTFKTRTEYKKHKYNHKTYTCSCGEIFHRWSIYCEHRRIKHIKKYTCKVCNMEFDIKINRDKHSRTHDDERTVLECPYENCERLYYYKRNLNYHVQKFHLKLKIPPPPSVQKRKKSNPEIKPPKTLESGRRPRKDKSLPKKSSALKLVGLQVPCEAEKYLVKGKQIDIEISDHSDWCMDTSDFSDLEVSVKMLRRTENKSDRSDSDSATPKMIDVK